jgi:hypothetical protein
VASNANKMTIDLVKPDVLRTLLESKTRDELTILAKQLSLSGYSRLDKAQVIALILSADERALRRIVVPTWWQKYHNHVYGVASIVGLILTVVFFYWPYLWQDAGEAKESRDGNTAAKFDIVDGYPKLDDVPAGLLKHSEMTDSDVPTLLDLNDLHRFNPGIVTKNNGSKPIDTVRVEVRHLGTIVDTATKSEEMQKRKSPWLLKNAARVDYPLSHKLLPGKTAQIDLKKELLSMMVQLQSKDNDDCLHYGAFEVRVMAKLVGATAFDAAEEHKSLVNFAWLPKGFPDDECQEALRRLDLTPIIEQ